MSARGKSGVHVIDIAGGAGLTVLSLARGRP